MAELWRQRAASKASGLHHTDPVTVASAVQARLRAGDFEGAEKYFEDEFGRHAQFPIRRDAMIILTSFIEAFARAGNLERAEAAFERIESLNARPNIRTFNAILKATCATGDHRKASHYYRKAVALGIEPDSYSYNSLIMSCAKATYAEGALQWLDTMAAQSVEPHLLGYDHAISACSRSDPDRFEMTWQLLDRAIQLGLRPSLGTYKVVFRCCLRCGDVARKPAEGLFRSMVASRVEPDGAVRWNFTKNLDAEL
ncbi:unnamed protein product [Prorocentrum cordatum]|uniref:Pentacotripeptide-repeat region of PRORP domain-containing protein n=1 Tax=Prorocentrum cordatum TaxID=2364126 RepID=A0ABN9T2V7_9DINO|nr:unnamed protein product [Polarella glacialis]